MDSLKLTVIATSLIAFSSFLGVFAAFVYYAYQMLEIGIYSAVTLGNIYIFINISFLYLLKVLKVIEW